MTARCENGTPSYDGTGRLRSITVCAAPATTVRTAPAGTHHLCAAHARSHDLFTARTKLLAQAAWDELAAEHQVGGYPRPELTPEEIAALARSGKAA